jgi:hypothetical protein
MARTSAARKARTKPSTVPGSNTAASRTNNSTPSGSNRPADDDAVSVASFPLALKAEVPWDVAVAEGKRIVAAIIAADEEQHRRQMRLGELADTVERKYGDDTFVKFAKEVGTVVCTLERHRDVWRAWRGAPGRVLEVVRSKYAVARELATHPRRVEIITENPAITKAKAVEVMREHRRDEAVADPIGHRRLEKKEWWDAILKLANKAVGKAAEICGDDYAILRGGVVDPKRITEIKDAGNALLKLKDELEALFPDFFGREFNDDDEA